MFLILITVIIVLIVFDLLFNKDIFNLTHTFQGPIRLPGIGGGYVFLVDRTKILNVLDKITKEYGKRASVYIISQLHVLITDPELVEGVMSSTELITKSDAYDYLHPWLGQGLLTATGPRWKSHRKFLTPAFHFNILKTFLPIFLKNDQTFVKKLRKLANGKPVDVFPIVALAALDNVSESAMGVSVEAQEHTESEYVKAVKDISEIIFMRMRHPFYRYHFFFNLSRHKRIQDKSLAILHGFTNDVIKSRRRTLELSKTTLENYDSSLGIKRKCAFLDMLLLSEVDGRKLPDEVVREEVDTFMFEGHDTTTSAISFALFCISRNPKVQNELFEEQKTIFGDDTEREITMNDLNEMKYLELCIKETLRLYPSVPLIARRTMKKTVIKDCEIPADATIVVDLIHMQRRPEVFEDPLAFKPERFTAEEMTKRNPYSWISFSAGPRNCIGQRFAMMETKVMLSTVIRNFTLLPADQEPQLVADLILKSNNGVFVKLLPRTH